MAVYIYHEYMDGSGEGQRADLIQCELIQQAHDKVVELSKDEDFVRAQVIVGSITETYERDKLEW